MERVALLLSYLLFLPCYRLRRRQLYPESASDANFRVDTAPSLHPLHRFFDNGPTNSGTGKRFLAMETLEDLKYPIEMSLFNADTSVLHVQPCLFPNYFGEHSDAGGSTTLGELQGIAQQVLD